MEFGLLIGKTLKSISASHDKVIFECVTGEKYSLSHS